MIDIWKVWGLDTPGDTNVDGAGETSDSTWECGDLNSIVIEGDQEFVRYVKNCLLKIAEHRQFESIVALIKKIRQAYKAGMQWDGAFDVDLATLRDYLSDDFIWGASQMIHDAAHYQRMLAGTFDCSDPIGEELIAFEPQEKFLRDCGREDHALYIANCDGSHALR